MRKEFRSYSYWMGSRRMRRASLTHNEVVACNKKWAKLKKARERKFMTQGDVANETGICYASLSRWEKDDSFPNSVHIQKLCRALSISPNELLGWEPSEMDHLMVYRQGLLQAELEIKRIRFELDQDIIKGEKI